MSTGNTLIEEINSTHLSPHEVALWWLGQHSFILKWADKVVYVDPFLSNLSWRLSPSPLEAEEVTNASLILITHEHRDHYDKEVLKVIAKQSPKTFFICPHPLRERLIEECEIHEERVIGLGHDECFEREEIVITGVRADHEEREWINGYDRFMGYIISHNTESMRVYHAGDTLVWDRLAYFLRSKVDVLLLPINGRSPEKLQKGIIGNMNAQEAAELAMSLEAKYAIPAHYDLHPENLADPEEFKGYVTDEKVKVVIPKVIEKITLS